jgi:shikimate dehydrogenase
MTAPTPTHQTPEPQQAGRQTPPPGVTPTRFAVIGHPVSHSRSPAIHQQFAAQTHIALTYERLEAPLDAFKREVIHFFEQGGAGLNVTVPFKLEAYELAQHHLSVRAQQAQAVNTLWMKDGQLHGCNTDGVGLVSDLKRLGAQGHSARILLIGAGGAARGVIGPLLDRGCQRLHVVNRTAQRAHDLVAEWQTQVPRNGSVLSSGSLAEAAQPEGWDVVINASASSLSGAAPDVPTCLYAAGAWAYDMMYAAAPTPFMIQAQADGATHVSDGLGMLVGQAAESFFLWHGVRPEVQPVLETLRAALR